MEEHVSLQKEKGEWNFERPQVKNSNWDIGKKLRR
jgi:hypothetical protein